MGSDPPRSLVLLADWASVLGGLVLFVTFTILMLALTFGFFATDDEHPTGLEPDLLQTKVQVFTMHLQGLLYFIGGVALTTICVKTGNAQGAMCQTMVSFGSLFFFVSGWGNPSQVVSLRYLLPVGSDVTEDHAWMGVPVSFADVCPYYGATCFMVANLVNLISVWDLPKNRLVSPFWGVTFFFLGAWSIGALTLWGPIIVCGFSHVKDFEPFGSPSYRWTWIHVMRVMGSISLICGGVVFGLLDDFLSLHPSAREEPVRARASMEMAPLSDAGRRSTLAEVGAPRGIVAEPARASQPGRRSCLGEVGAVRGSAAEPARASHSNAV